MDEKVPIENHTETFKKWLVKYITSGIVGFCLGVLSTIFLGKFILVSDIPEPVQDILRRLNGTPDDLSGNYYYISTPQNIPNIPVKCDGNSNAKVIAGFVKIEHKKTIIHPTISFLKGERKYCISTRNKVLKLPIPITWKSSWAHISDGELYAKIKIGDDKEGILEASDLNNKYFHDNNKYFHAHTIYMWEEKGSPAKRVLGKIDIKFAKCKLSECDMKLKSVLSKY